ncbi:N-acetylmuramoyl-L-alanine amidase [Solilutibacter silvestris]|uniref:N-acetylmuramoyl-L-alanine amidase n=1 Tax=Solilutibacter silvestris TaxID=1645665 RepID=A0A2K1Q455_9GAMM|nr:N-acetylmuramoyl-L-alanine amidase [Lysobacter silvestris]PNS09727.1 Negative regulator of beta-lactamase [Lysobacter silvestris]
MPTPFAIDRNALPYEARLTPRELSDIDTVVIHCTELPDLASAREFGEKIHYADSDTGNSGHYYIDRDGSLHQWVDDGRVAHHTRGWNPRSIGIELVNRGRWPDWMDSRHQAMDEPYTDAQVVALIDLLRDLQQRLPRLQWIAGHEDLDTDMVPSSDDPTRLVHRKRDPGPHFPWQRIEAAVALRRIPVGTKPDSL